MEFIIGLIIGMLLMLQWYWNERVIRIMIEKYYHNCIKDLQWWRDYYDAQTPHKIDEAIKLAGDQMKLKDDVIEERDKEIQRLKCRLNA